MTFRVRAQITLAYENDIECDTEHEAIDTGKRECVAMGNVVDWRVTAKPLGRPKSVNPFVRHGEKLVKRGSGG